MKNAVDAICLLGTKETLSVLLIKRKYPPFQNFWAFPGGFVEDGESDEDAVIRELEEETSIKNLRPKFKISKRVKKGRDPRRDVASTPFVFFLDHVNENDIFAKDDAKEAKFFRINEIPSLAFDHGAMFLETLAKFFPHFRSQHFLELLPGFFCCDNLFESASELTFFGGSFNPLHHGHISCIELFLKYRDKCAKKNRLVVIPDSNPWKRLRESDEPKDYWHEFIKIQKTLKPYHLSIYPGFFGLESENYTIDWLKVFFENEKNKNLKINLLMGDDCFLALEKWKEFEKLLQLISKIFVVERISNSNEIEKYSLKMRTINQRLQIINLGQHQFQNLSSTIIRTKS